MNPDENKVIPQPVNGWNEWSRYVLKELERLNACFEKIDGKVDKLGERMTLLQVKVAGIAVISSLITSLIALVVAKFLGNKIP